jgi:hypothetical protein
VDNVERPRVRVHQLRTYDLPDVGDHLIHFTGRIGPKTDDVDPIILKRLPQQRLAHILVDGVIRGFQTFGAGAPVVCLTESTKAAVTRLVFERRYEPCGIGFSKQFVFERNGGPALYVRGDEWEAATSNLLQPIRSRLVRFWPGAVADSGEYLPDALSTPSEWLHEREWRVPTELRFSWEDVEFLIVPDLHWQSFYAEWLADWAGNEYASVFAKIPTVVMASTGDVLRDQLGLWAAK